MRNDGGHGAKDGKKRGGDVVPTRSPAPQSPFPPLPPAEAGRLGVTSRVTAFARAPFTQLRPLRPIYPQCTWLPHAHTHTHTHTHRCSILYTMYMFSNLPLPPHPHTLHTSRQVITFKQMFLMHPMHKDEVVTLVMGEEEAAKYLDSQ